MLNSSINTLHLYIILVEKIIDFIEGKRRKRKVMSTPLGETLEKVDEAQNHLTDAIESIDVIKHQVTMEREALDSLLGEVSKKREQYNKATSDLELTQELLNQDQDKLRIVLGFNSSREKIVGFISGVIASILATAIWVAAPKMWNWLVSIIQSSA